jgi:hypothetical protein
LAFEYAEPQVTFIYSFLLKRRMRWAGHVANMGAKLLARRPERNTLEYLSGHHIIRDLKKEDGNLQSGFIWLWVGSRGRLL